MSMVERSEPVVHVSNLAKSYRGQRVVEGISLTVEPGEIAALVGANGGGKTTTLRMLAGLLEPDAGEGTVLGRNVRRPEQADRKSTGYMTQRICLYPELSVTQNLAFRAAIFRLDNIAHIVSETIERFGLTRYATARVDTLSGGWARRVQFAATTIHKPALLLLDEPTAGLDTVTKADLWSWLHQLAQQETAIVISTHDLAEAGHCSKLLHYLNGKASGPMRPDELRHIAQASTLDLAISSLAQGGSS